MIREKQTRSGKLLEADFYPVTRDGRQLGRGPQTKRSSAEQKKYNKLQAQKRVIRLVNANFGEEDILMTLTFIPDDDVDTEKQAKRKISNFIRRVKTYRERKARELRALLKSMPKSQKYKKALKKAEAPLKYLYAVESAIYRRGKNKGKRRYHFHLFITGCGDGDRDGYEKLWKGRTNADRYRPQDFGPEAAAKYISKDCGKQEEEESGNVSGKTKRYVCSRNLKKPDQKVKDNKLSKRKVELMAKKHLEDSAYWERRYKGYKFVRCYARWNEFNLSWYVSVVMYRTGSDSPPWSIDDWFTYE